MEGKILNIQRFCIDDGPGIRSTVFLKGCPLHCLWCHNPESQMIEPQILYNKSKCIGCEKCAAVCEQGCHLFEKSHIFNREKCVGCGKCASVCETYALELYGKIMTVKEVFEEVKRDKIFYETSNGGVTISGGEPLFQPKFSAGILRECKNIGIHTAIETSGIASEDNLKLVIKYCDLVLFDIKITDENDCLKMVGSPFDVVLRTLSIINEQNIPFIIRAPIIPTVNDTEKHFFKIKEIKNSMKNCLGVQVMPYHKTGVYKYAQIGREYPLKNVSEPSAETVEKWRKFFK